MSSLCHLHSSMVSHFTTPTQGKRKGLDDGRFWFYDLIIVDGNFRSARWVVMSRLSLTLFGGFAARLDGQLITRFESARVRALLAYLAVENGRFHPRDHLATLLWPDQPDRTAHDNLRQALANLRQAVGDKTAVSPHLLITRDTVQWNPDSHYSLDTATFNHHLAACQHHPHRHPERCPTCAHHWQTAVSLYHGHFLQPFPSPSPLFEEWALLHREQWRQIALDILFHLTTYHERQTHYDQATHYARRQIELDPWREEAHHQIMRLLARQGQRTAALSQYQQCATILHTEFGVEPALETTATYIAIRNGRLSPISPTPLHLPTPAQAGTTPLIGRETELTQLSDWLNHPTCRLVTLVGSGGIGKTRLAIAAAEQLTAVFPHGLHFIPLATLTTPDQLPTHLLKALHLTPGPSPLTQLITHLQHQETLLILDNYEQILPHVETITHLLQGAPHLCLLITSRQPLGLQCEWLFDVAGLDYPSHEADPAPQRYHAVQLFLHHATHHNRFFSPAQEMAGLIRICQLTEGMPLAIELAAAMSRHQPTAQLATDMKNGRFSLTTSWPDAPPHHRSLWAMLEHSWHLLTPTEQTTFNQLSLFHSSFTAEAATAIAQTTPAILQQLVQKSLLRLDKNGRYTLHELIRQYAASKLGQSPDAENSHGRYFTHYHTLATTAAPHLQTAQQQTWLTQLDQEQPNFRTALTWGLTHAHAPTLQLATALAPFWHIRGYHKEGGDWLTAVLSTSITPTPARAHALIWAAKLLANHSPTAQQLAQEGLHLFQQLQDQVGIAQALTHLGDLALGQSNNPLATRLFTQSLTLWRQIGNKTEIARALTNCAQMAREYLTDNALSQSYLEESLTLAREANNPLQMAYAYNGLADLAARQGNYPQEATLLTHCLHLFQQLGAKSNLAWTHCNLGENAWHQQNLLLADSHYQTCLPLFQELGSKRGTAITLYLLGQLAHHQGHCHEATSYYHQSLQIAHPIAFTNITLRTLAGLGGLWLQQGNPHQATQLLAAVYTHLNQLPLFLTPADRAEYDQYITLAQKQLGNRFAPAWAIGATWSLTTAVNHAPSP